MLATACNSCQSWHQHITPNQTKPTKPNVRNRTYQTKSNLAFQAYRTKPTKPRLLVKAVNAWVRSAFGNVSSCFTEVQIVPYQLLTCTKPHSSLDHYFCSHSHHVAGLLVFRPVLFSERSGILSPYGRGRLALLHRNLCPAFIVFNTRDNSIRSPGLTNILN